MALGRLLERLSPDRRAGLSRVSGEGFAAAFSSTPDASGTVSEGSLRPGVLGQAHERFGISCFARVDGNFSACLYDPARRTFLIGGDPVRTVRICFGEAEGLVFGTSPLEVLRAMGRARQAVPAMLARFLVDGAATGCENSFFAHVGQVPAGQALEFVPGGKVRRVALEDPMEGEPADRGTLEEHALELRGLVLGSVASLVQGRTGLALSGGIDSSGLGAALRDNLGRDAPIRALCFVHGHRDLPASTDERPWAELAARHLGADLRLVGLAAAEIPGVLARVARSQDLPFGSPVVLAQAEVFRIAAEEGIETLLSGHGPDYLLGGGDSHIRARAIALMRSGRVGAAWRFIRGAAPYGGTTARHLLDDSLRQALPIQRGGAAARTGVNASWFREREVDVESLLAPTRGVLRAMIRSQLRTRLPSALAWEAGNAAAAGLRVRFPYLVASIARFCASLPDEQLVSDSGQTRPVLRAALRGLVPDPILDRPHPVGFAVPALPWLHEAPHWVDERLRRAAELPFCAPGALRDLREALGRGDPRAWSAAFVLWRWITLVEWAEAHGVSFA